MVVGLGNPGPRHKRTRHNAGFWFVDQLAERNGSAFRAEAKFFGEACELSLDGHRLRLLKPQTFMNRSGQAVAAMARFYQLSPEAILVVHDEVDLPVGSLRLKQGGGHAGHNGVRDVIAQLKSADFVRLRIGVGHPGHKDEVHDHVLHATTADEEASIQDSIDEAMQLLLQILAGDFPPVMNVLHRRPRRSDETEPDDSSNADQSTT